MMIYNIEKLHKDEQDIFQSKIEVAELQKAISDSHLAIFDEK
jgi:hypothetical protein